MTPSTPPEGPDELVLAYWNPQFLAYCAARGQPDPTEQLVKDAAAYPGDKLRYFLDWLASQWTQYLIEHDPDIDITDWRENNIYTYRRLHAKAFTTWVTQRWLPQQPHLGIRINREKEDK